MINPTEFVYKDSIWQDIFSHLHDEGFEVYGPNSKQGECLSEYIVVKNNGSSRFGNMIHGNISSDSDLYSIMCYVPRNSYSILEPFVQRVKASMRKIKPLVLPYGSQTPSFYDDSVKAHMISIEYRNMKKIL